MKKSKKNEWHDRVVAFALVMGSSRHIGKRRALYMASHWLSRAGDRMKEGRDVYTGNKLITVTTKGRNERTQA